MKKLSNEQYKNIKIFLENNDTLFVLSEKDINILMLLKAGIEVNTIAQEMKVSQSKISQKIKYLLGTVELYVQNKEKRDTNISKLFDSILLIPSKNNFKIRRLEVSHYMHTRARKIFEYYDINNLNDYWEFLQKSPDGVDQMQGVGKGMRDYFILIIHKYIVPSFRKGAFKNLKPPFTKTLSEKDKRMFYLYGIFSYNDYFELSEEKLIVIFGKMKGTSLSKIIKKYFEHLGVQWKK